MNDSFTSEQLRRNKEFKILTEITSIYNEQTTVTSVINNSPYKLYYEVLIKNFIRNRINIDEQTKMPNFYYSPELFDIIKKKMYLLPLWSGVMINKNIFKTEFTRLTNNPVENWFGNLKNDILKNKRVFISELTTLTYSRLKSKYIDIYGGEHVVINKAEKKKKEELKSKNINSITESWKKDKKKNKNKGYFYSNIKNFGDFKNNNDDGLYNTIVSKDFDEAFDLKKINDLNFKFDYKMEVDQINELEVKIEIDQQVEINNATEFEIERNESQYGAYSQSSYEQIDNECVNFKNESIDGYETEIHISTINDFQINNILDLNNITDEMNSLFQNIFTLYSELLSIEKNERKNYIKKVFLENKNTFRSVIAFIRNKTNYYTVYNDESVDDRYKDLIKASKLENYKPIKTNGDGNCFYRCISHVLFGSEEKYFLVKMCSIYLLIANEHLFRYLREKHAYETDFDEFINKTIGTKTKIEWANQNNIISVELLLEQTINIYSFYLSKNINKTAYSLEYRLTDNVNKPIITIALKDSHFVTLLASNKKTEPPKVNGEDIYEPIRKSISDGVFVLTD